MRGNPIILKGDLNMTERIEEIKKELEAKNKEGSFYACLTGLGEGLTDWPIMACIAIPVIRVVNNRKFDFIDGFLTVYGTAGIAGRALVRRYRKKLETAENEIKDLEFKKTTLEAFHLTSNVVVSSEEIEP